MDVSYKDYVGNFEATAKSGETDHTYEDFKLDS